MTNPTPRKKPKYQTVIIAAADQNGAIGFEGRLPWSNPEDMRRFVALTSGKVILMGRKTADGLPKPLKNRVNLVLTRDRKWSKPGFIPVYDLWDIRNQITKHPIKELWVIGGAEIYKRFLPYADTVHLTLLDVQVPEADAWFPMGMLDQFQGRVVIPSTDPIVNFWVMSKVITAPSKGDIK